MDYIGNSQEQLLEMCQAIGISSVEELFKDIPSHLLLQRPAGEDGLSELEGMRRIEERASENTYTLYDSYLGAGAYEHHIPPLVEALCSKSGFLTSYTPYQPEASQGTLQAIYEFQSAICSLTGLTAANASLYDGAAACAEAALMALRLRKGRSKVIVSQAVHPHYRAVMASYLKGCGATLVTLPIGASGLTNPSSLDSILTDDVAAVLYQSPNFLGLIEDGRTLCQLSHDKGALALLCANPISYALYSNAAEVGADIAVGECQPLGIPLNFGGPYAGYMACREEYVRQLPGRIVGRAHDAQGREGYVLTLQAREQHIRREKATSNICTNQSLMALASLVTMLWYGPEGLRRLALTNWRRACYLKKGLSSLRSVATNDNDNIFNEFVVTFDMPTDQVMALFHKRGILPGIALDKWYPQLGNAILVCVTETKDLQQLDRYIEVAQYGIGF